MSLSCPPQSQASRKDLGECEAERGQRRGRERARSGLPEQLEGEILVGEALRPRL